MKKTRHIDDALRDARTPTGAKSDTATVQNAYERLRALRGQESRARSTPRRRETPSAAKLSVT